VKGFLITNKYLSLLAAFLAVVANVIIAHFFVPIGIILSPIIIVAAVAFISINKISSNALLQTILTFALVAVNDIGIKLYAGGLHDSEGQGVINLLFIGNMILCFIILLIFLIRNRVSLVKNIASIAIFVLLAFMHLHFFGDLGLE